MAKILKAALIGVGIAGSKVHLTSAAIEDGKVKLHFQSCGTNAAIGLNRGYKLSEQFIEYNEDEFFYPQFRKAEKFFAEEIQNTLGACSKCVKYAQKLLNEN
jgi:hypothetical protein